MRTIIILISLICFTAIPSFAGSGLQVGNTVTWKKGNEIFSGRLVDSNMEKKEVTVITPSGKGVKLRLRNIARITATGDKKKITPSWSYTTSTYAIFRFETIDGKSVEGGVYEWPIFDIEVNGVLEKNIWLHHLAFIEAGGSADTGRLVGLQGSPVPGSGHGADRGRPVVGLQVGARVRYVSRGDTFSGTISDISLKEPLTIILPSSNSIKLELKNIRRITNTGQNRRITPSWSYTETNYRLYEFQTIDGKTILGAVYMNPVFDVDTGTTGMQKNIWIEHIDFIETE